MSKIREAVMRLPKLTTRKVWAGLYGGHRNVIVFFNEKPKRTAVKDSRFDPPHYCCLENQDIIAGSMWLGDFKGLFPDFDLKPYLTSHGVPKEIEILEVFEMKLTAVWDGNGLRGSEFHADGW